MTTSARRPSVSFCVAIVALVVATGSTSYAAGLARNSVGTAQLKPGAVTSAKIQEGAVTGSDVLDGALTGADLRNGTVGAADLAADVLPRTTTFSRNGISDTGGEVPAITAHGIEVTMRCDTTNHAIDLFVQGAGASGVELTGTYHQFNVDRHDSLPVMSTGGYQLLVGASTFGTNATVVFDGTARALPDGDPVHLTVGGFVQRGFSSTPTYCDVRVYMAPLP